MSTVTHGYSEREDPDRSNSLPRLSFLTAVVWHGVRVLHTESCHAHEPHTPRPLGAVLVDYLDRLGHWQRRSVCLPCLPEFLATLDGSEVIVWHRNLDGSDREHPEKLGVCVPAPVVVLADLAVVEPRRTA